MANEELKLLGQKRGTIKASLTRFTTFVQNFDDNKRILELQTRLDKVEALWHEFETIQAQIELLDDTELQRKERYLFEDNFFDIVSLSKEIILERKQKEVSLTNEYSSLLFNSNSNTRNIHLPTLSLPTFYGDYDKWLHFRDTFKTLVHNDVSLNDVTKFHYLLSCLKGNAEQVLRSLDVSEANYNIAWELLNERFENKAVIIRNHVKALFQWPSILKESHTLLRKMLDGMLQHLRALDSLGEPTNKWDTLIIYLFSNKLDAVSKCEWEKSCAKLDSPTLTDFKTFISNRCHILESMDNNSYNNKAPKQFLKSVENSNNKQSRTQANVSTNMSPCKICKNSHYIFNCQKFISLSVDSRLQEIKKRKMCTNCLRDNHVVENCTSPYRCKKCGKKHNTLLHLNENRDENNSVQPNVQSNTNTNAQNAATVSQENTSVTTYCAHKKKSEVLLSTALAYIFDKYGNKHDCRILLDSGSQSNFITKNLCDNLQLNKHKTNISIAGINQIQSNISYRTNATIQSKHNSYKINLPFLILDKITENLPVAKINIDNITIPHNITLADPSYNIPGVIDILLGANIFFDLLAAGQIKLGPHQPTVQKTKLGWILSGSVPYSATENGHSKTLLCNFSVNKIEDQLEKFWKLEEICQTPRYNKEEAECEEYFRQTTKRDQNGRFVVSLPTRENISELGDSYETAFKRFQSLEQKLSKNMYLKNLYVNFMKEYQDLGHMAPVDSSKDSNVIHYLPHHGVYKETSTTTKLRVVFDASAKTDSGISLNDKLKVGPTIQDDLFSILIRFRKHNYVIAADIAKMYRQVRVEEEQWNLQRILWREKSDQPIEHFQLRTVTYGTACAAFLAIRCLHQLAIENQSSHPMASKAIFKDFYVDDLLTGTNSIEQTRKLRDDLNKILESSGFQLRKWISNNNEILEASDNSPSITHFISDDKITKTLGLLWNAEEDIFKYTINDVSNRNSVTKRKILSVISQIFDPLGLLGPAIVKVKIIIQKLWQLKIGWDEAIPLDLFTTWTRFYYEIQCLNHIKIPRHVICFNPISIQLHCFCDASESAYGCCIYVRSVNSQGICFIKLLCAKSRVAPLKNTSLPKLELCGALLLAQLTSKVNTAIDINFKPEDIYYWCDSTVVLSWISADSRKWKTFVANRVAEIQELTKIERWKHISTNDNPADIISRGMDPEEILFSELWWKGPQWLQQDPSKWPIPTHEQLTDDTPERRKNVNVTLVTNIPNHNIFNKFSTFSKLQRVVAYCLRFLKNASSRENRITGSLSVSELNNSLTTLVRLVQLSEFSKEIESLQKSNSISPKSKLNSLNPFLDINGLIRVGGRLKNSKLLYEHKHPLVLPGQHPFTKLLIVHEHIRHLHAGAQATLAAIRMKYWPLNGRNTIRGVLRQCITCFKAKPRDTYHQMGQLPEARLKPTRAFSTVGIDIAGPFFVKDGKLRNRKIIKCYLCIFICFVTKATHLELAGDLSAESFLNALKRFVSRRGLCNQIFTDNGTNFVGASNELKQLYNTVSKLNQNLEINAFLTQNSITWKFIPPRSPHFGGLWEAAVKSAKHHLKRILGNASLTFEHLYTVITQVEAVLNSRPLGPLSNDPNDLLPLTPGHFLIGEPLTALPQKDVQEIPTNRLSNYHRLQQLVQHFWKRWSGEYLSSLQQRTKWKLNQENGLKVNSIVLLKNENCPPLDWKLGRITEVFPGEDNIIRVVNVKTSRGIVKRAVSKICMLPIET